MGKGKITIRNWKTSDIQSLVTYANNKKIADNLRDAFPHPYTEKNAEEFINACINADPDKIFFQAIDLDGKAIGSIGISFKDDVYSKSAELGYWLAEEYWGNGIITEAIKEICKTTFKDHDVSRIFAEPFAGNLGSRKALEKAGFVLEGTLKKSVYKNGILGDSCIYALLK